MSKIEDDIKTLQQQVETLTTIVKGLIPENTPNKDGIPIGSKIFGEVDEVGEIELEVLKKGYVVKKINTQDIIQGKKFKSLSAAAEAFSQIKRKSGWIFWHDKNGKTLKEAYKG